MFFSYRANLFYRDAEGNTFPVRKVCGKLVISSTSTDKVEGIDRVFTVDELILKLGIVTIETETDEIADAVEDTVEQENSTLVEPKKATKRGRPAGKAPTPRATVTRPQKTKMEVAEEVVEATDAPVLETEEE